MAENSNQNEEKEEKSSNSSKNESSNNNANTAKICNCLAYFYILFFLPLVVKQDSQTAKFYANQGLVLLLFTIITEALSRIVFLLLPLLGNILSVVFGVICLIFVIIGVICAATDKEYKLPIIGKIRIIR